MKADAKAVHAALNLRPTGQRQRSFLRPEARRSSIFPFYRRSKSLCGATLPTGWSVLTADHWALEDGELPVVSRLGEAIYCFVEEHVMESIASGWQDGKEVWFISHDCQINANHLEVRGNLPPVFTSIRDKHLEKQASESEEDVDHIFDIPVELARELTGFRHDQEISGAPDEPFEVLEAMKRKKWWGLS